MEDSSDQKIEPSLVPGSNFHLDSQSNQHTRSCCSTNDSEDDLVIVLGEDAESSVSEDSEEASDSEEDTDSDDQHSDDDYDLATRITNHLRNDEYICLICTCELETDSKFWSCKDCYRVYHIECIDSWSKKGSSTDDTGNWKCPACNSIHGKQKFQNRCWCKKVIHPEENEMNPGSCGQTCGAQLEGCVHRCTLPCHPGPHASCNALGPEFKCHCGNNSQQWPCVLTPYVEGWKCEDVCPEYMSCEIHKCSKVCHQELCGKCEEFMESKCYCGKTTDMIKCHARKPQKSFSKGKSKNKNWIGNFKCSVESDVHYDCNIHSRILPCQPVNKKSLHCPLSVDIITSCHCGKTPIASNNSRINCTDPIPTCDEICNKILPCGHSCKWKCHEGECSPCFQTPLVKCRCGNHEFLVPCRFIQSGKDPVCSKKCFALMSCRRHTCNKICCANEQTALARERTRKRNIRTNAGRPSSSRDVNESFNIEANHICLEICNKKLSCGNPDHICKRTCHSGSCPPCLESSNDDLSCHCGKTVLMAPIRCGRKLPPCENQCVRELTCGHDQMPHHCHPDDVQCLKCTKTVEKCCNCGKTLMKAMCYQNDTFCAERCGKVLPCKHRCTMSCHKESDSPCSCTSICGVKKKFCAHFDRRKCHYPLPCNIDHVPCQEKVHVSCKCGNLKKVIPCGAYDNAVSSDGLILDCEMDCVMKERDSRLRAAFGVSSSIPSEGSISMEDLRYVADTMKTTLLQNRWCLNIEATFKNFMLNSTDRTYHFKPMKREQRKFIHEMAEAYSLKSEAHDPEPSRSIVIKRTKDAKVPIMTLMEGVQLYQKYLVQQRKKAVQAKIDADNRLKTPIQSTSNFEDIYSEFNAIAISDTIVGITISDLQNTLAPVFEENGIFSSFEVEWETSDSYMVIFDKFMKLPKKFELQLKKIVMVLKDLLKSHFLANTVHLVKIDQFGVVLQRMKVDELTADVAATAGCSDTNDNNNNNNNNVILADDAEPENDDNSKSIEHHSTLDSSDTQIECQKIQKNGVTQEEEDDDEELEITMEDYMETEEDKLKDEKRNVSGAAVENIGL